MSRYKLTYTQEFKRDYKTFLRDTKLLTKIDNVLYTLTSDPFSLRLRTHQVNISSQGKCWSSRITRDLRVLWVFSKEDKDILIALRIGGHDIVYR